MGVAFGLAAAFLWGLADFNAAVASRLTGAFRVVLGFHLVATVILAVIVVATGELAGFDPRDLWKFAWVGALGTLSYLTFYKALEIGPISILSPIVSAYAAVSLILAVLVLDEVLTTGQLVAALVILGGVLLASADLRAVHTIERRQLLGFVLAFVTVVAIGVFVFGNAYYAIDYGWLLPIFLTRGFATVFLLALSLSERQLALPGALAEAARDHRAAGGRRHRRVRRLQPRRRAGRDVDRLGRVRAVRRDPDRRRRLPLQGAPVADPVARHRRGDRRRRAPRPGKLVRQSTNVLT